LRGGAEWPCRQCATKSRDEFPAPHAIPQGFRYDQRIELNLDVKGVSRLLPMSAIG
jgi:hypothetical protein